MSDWNKSQNEHECEDLKDYFKFKLKVDQLNITQWVTCPTLDSFLTSLYEYSDSYMEHKYSTHYVYAAFKSDTVLVIT